MRGVQIAIWTMKGMYWREKRYSLSYTPLYVLVVGHAFSAFHTSPTATSFKGFVSQYLRHGILVSHLSLANTVLPLRVTSDSLPSIQHKSMRFKRPLFALNFFIPL